MYSIQSSSHTLTNSSHEGQMGFGIPPSVLHPFTDGFVTGLRPNPKLTLSEWANRKRILPRECAKEYGPYDVARTPYLKEPMDCLSLHSDTKEVVLVKPTQIAATDGIGNNFLFYVADHCPRPCLMVLPTTELARRHSKSKVAPSLRAMDCLKDKVRDIKSREGGNTILIKEFPGGSWSFIGSNSSAAFRSVSICYLILDDVDGYEGDVGGEGDPVDLAKKRLDSYSAISKVLAMSTPTLKEFSRIWNLYEHTDMCVCHLPCPFCGEYQELQWGGPDADFGIKWDSGNPDTARYMCKYCHKEFQEHYKNKIMTLGTVRWVPQKVNNNPRTRGFQISSLYSPLGWVSWSMIVDEFLKAKNSAEKLQVWYNTRLGLPFEAKGERPDWVQLKSRAEAYRLSTVPDTGYLLTAGVDVQADRLVTVVRAWGVKEESWLVWYDVIYGDPEKDEVWKELDTILDRDYLQSDGFALKIACVAIDSSYNTHRVYNCVRTRSPRAIAIKGMSTPGKPVLGRPSWQDVTLAGNTIKRGVQLWPIGSDTAKTLIYSRLKIDDITTTGLSTIHFPRGLDDDYYRQLTAEKLVTRYTSDGYPKKVWVKPSGARNDVLDTEVYCLAAAVRAGVNRLNWTDVKSSINLRKAQKSNPEVTSGVNTHHTRPRRIQSKYMRRT